MKAAAHGFADAVKVLIGNAADVSGADQRKRTPLFRTAENGHVDVVQCLLDAGVANMNTSDDAKVTLLMRAAASGFVEIIQLLVEGGADTSLRDEDGHSALYFAAHNGRHDADILRSQRDIGDSSSGDELSAAPLSTRCSIR